MKISIVIYKTVFFAKLLRIQKLGTNLEGKAPVEWEGLINLVGRGKYDERAFYLIQFDWLE